MVVDVIKVFSSLNVKGTWFKGTATHSNDDCFRLMYLARSSDSEEVTFFLNFFYSFIEEDWCIKSFDLLDQAIAQFFTS